MIITNKYNLPDYIYEKMARNFKPEVGKVGVTDLIDSPYIRWLKRTRWDDITIDASDKLATLGGTAFHLLMESWAPRNSLPEERLHMECKGLLIKGRPDLFWDDRLHDYKYTSTWKYLLGEKMQFERQLNVYAHMYRIIGFVAKGLEVVWYFKDWQSKKRLRDKDYPVIQLLSSQPVLWAPDNALEYIERRVNIHLIDPPEPCSEEDRWTSHDKWAVKKKGNKMALRGRKSVFENEDDAQHLCSLIDGTEVEFRPGEDKRCKYYCDCRYICPVNRHHDEIGQEGDEE